MTTNFVLILVSSIIGIVATTLNDFVNRQYEKNKYLAVLRNNSAIDKVLLEVNQIEIINKNAQLFFCAGWFLGYIYFNFALIYIIKILVFMSDNDLCFFYFNINPYVGINGKAIDAAYFNVAIFVLAIIWYSIYKRIKLNVIPGQSVTWTSKGLLYTLYLLAGAMLSSAALISIYIYKSIIPEFVFSEISLNLFWLVPFFIAGFLITILCTTLSFSKVRNTKKEAENRISKFYETGYPYVTISTSLKQIKGKVITVLDKNIIIIVAHDHKKTIATSWNDIKIIEVIDS